MRIPRERITSFIDLVVELDEVSLLGRAKAVAVDGYVAYLTTDVTFDVEDGVVIVGNQFIAEPMIDLHHLLKRARDLQEDV